MRTTDAQKHAIRTIISNLIAKNTEWLAENGIVVGDKGNFWILNYSQFSRNDINRLVRGMVIAKPDADFQGDLLHLIRSFPFMRFFNHGESEAAPVDFANAEMIEKLDGTMVGVFFHENKAAFHTRKMLSLHEPDNKISIKNFRGQQFNFLDVIGSYVNTLQFDEKDFPYTYIFEFIHKASHVLTEYAPHQYGLYLLGARNVSTHVELSEDELDEVAKSIGAFRPRRFNAIHDLDAIHKEFSRLKIERPNFEGVVFRDITTGDRVKVKDLGYVEKHHMIDKTSYKYLVPIILKGETDEILAYFPHLQERIDKVNAAFASTVDSTVKEVMKWQAKGLSPKDLAIAVYGSEPKAKWEIRLEKQRGNVIERIKPPVENPFTRNMIVRYCRLEKEELIRKAVETAMIVTAIGHNNDGNPKQFVELIGLTEDEETQSVDEL